MRVAASSRRHSGTVPLTMERVRFGPQKEKPLSKSVSPYNVSSDWTTSV
jgi:hypothetical protein